MCVCVKGMALVPSVFRSGAVSVKVLMHHQESFHFLRPRTPSLSLVLGPRLGAGGFSDPHATPRLSPAFLC